MGNVWATLATAVLAAILSACTADHEPPSRESTTTTCTLVGCHDIVGVGFANLVGSFPDERPLFIEVCLDQEPCETLRVDESSSSDAGTPGDWGTGCLYDDVGLACCNYDPNSSLIADCQPTLAGDTAVYLSIDSDTAFDGAVHEVGVLVWGNSGELLVEGHDSATLVMRQPNGPECEPTCFQGGVVFECGTGA